MRLVFVLLGVGGLLGGVASGDLPDPDWCTVLPMDNMESPRVIGIPSEASLDAHRLDIWICALGGAPIADAFVEIILSPQCDDLCICEAAVLSGCTDDTGYLAIYGQLGGCCDLEPSPAVIIMAEGVAIRATEYVVSPDWDDVQGDCLVALPDFITFGQAFSAGSEEPCTDYDGDGSCRIEDFIIFGAGWGADCATE